MSRRINLREFQQSLIDRMQASHAADQISTLGVQAGGRNWLVDMHDLSGVLPLPPLAATPLTKPWFLGVTHVRGMLYGVTDLAAFQQSGRASGTTANRLLLVAERHMPNAALLVECVLGLRNARTWERAEVGGQAGYRDEQGNPWCLLDMAGLLGQPGFLQIGA